MLYHPLIPLIIFLTFSTASVATPIRRQGITSITNGSSVNGKTFDYIIAGGGTSGVVLARRLTEDAGRTVLIIEAGSDQEDNSGVTDATQYQSTFGVSPNPINSSPFPKPLLLPRSAMDPAADR